MTPRRTGRTQSCGGRDARTRLRDAYAQLALGELATDAASAAEKKAAASAVLAGIAASDATCCAALGERSRSQDHRDAVAMLRQVAPGGRDAAAHRERLLGLEDQARYGFEDLTGQRLVAALRHARALTTFAESILER